MKITLNFSQFMDNWPESRKDQFSYDALKAIFEHLEEYEESAQEEIEFDPIAICCDYTEYKSAIEAAQDYGHEEKELEENQAIEWLENKTTVLKFDGGIVLQQF